MTEYRRSMQWELAAQVWHDNHGWHIIEISELGKRGWSTPHRVGRWRGIGVPGPLLDLATACVADTLEGHLIRRYGIQDTLSPDLPGVGWSAD